MGEQTGIAWTTHTASPWFGCSKVSPGCTNCYAEFLTLQKGWAGWGDNSPRVRSKGFWKDAYKYDRKAGIDAAVHANKGVRFDRPRMFTSLMDWLDPKAPVEWLADFLKVIHDCQNLDWLLLTKRPELWRERVNHAYHFALERGIQGSDFRNWLNDWFTHSIAPENVWFGVTTENQEMVIERVPVLLGIPAKVRWLSVEPLLETVELNYNFWLDGRARRKDKSLTQTGFHPHIDWVVVGGESGGRRRDCGVDAISKVAYQCASAGVPCFVKQDCAQKPGRKRQAE